MSIKLPPVSTTKDGIVSGTAQTLGGGIKTFPDGIKVKESGAGSTTLSHFEEGTWTPVLSFEDGNGTASISTVYATFARFGKSVFYSARFIVTKGTGSGHFRVTGLPYTAPNVSNGFWPTNVIASATLALTAGRIPVAFVAPNTSRVEFWEHTLETGAFATITAAKLGTTATFSISGRYET